MDEINGFSTISRKFSQQGMHAGSKRSHPPCILSLLTIPSQKPRGPASLTGSMGSQALNPSLFRLDQQSHCLHSSLQSLPVQPVTCTRMAHRGCPGRPPACHPHGNRSIATLDHTSLPGLGSSFSGESQTKQSGAQVTSPGGPPADAEGRGRRLRRGLPGRPLGGTRVPAAQGPAAGPGAALRGAAGLTLLRCGSRVSR